MRVSGDWLRNEVTKRYVINRTIEEMRVEGFVDILPERVADRLEPATSEDWNEIYEETRYQLIQTGQLNYREAQTEQADRELTRRIQADRKRVDYRTLTDYRDR